MEKVGTAVNNEDSDCQLAKPSQAKPSQAKPSFNYWPSYVGNLLCNSNNNCYKKININFFLNWKINYLNVLFVNIIKYNIFFYIPDPHYWCKMVCGLVVTLKF